MIRALLAAAVLFALPAAGCSEGVGDDNEALSNLVPVDPDAPAEVLSWPDLMPEEEMEAWQALNEGRRDPSLMSRFLADDLVEGQVGSFNVVEDLDGLIVRMPGYLLPLDYVERGSAREFLLLPYHGACIHSPAPPPNQIVYLRSIEPIEFNALWDPVWVEGRMQVERVDTELAAIAYSMTARSVEPYRGGRPR
ncbi:MAG: DUF3299 domain-containing protein [Alphaproteobacteria bacterium]|nr:DUF3299 domain-containing protein [Alphaproteobacteria bacterium]